MQQHWNRYQALAEVTDLIRSLDLSRMVGLGSHGRSVRPPLYLGRLALEAFSMATATAPVYTFVKSLTLGPHHNLEDGCPLLRSIVWANGLEARTSLTTFQLS
jgi:hypothetical protein